MGDKETSDPLAHPPLPTHTSIHSFNGRLKHAHGKTAGIAMPVSSSSLAQVGDPTCTHLFQDGSCACAGKWRSWTGSSRGAERDAQLLWDHL